MCYSLRAEDASYAKLHYIIARDGVVELVVCCLLCAQVVGNEDERCLQLVMVDSAGAPSLFIDEVLEAGENRFGVLDVSNSKQILTSLCLQLWPFEKARVRVSRKPQDDLGGITWAPNKNARTGDH